MSTMRLHSEPMVLRIANAISQFIGFGKDDITPASPTSKQHTAEPEPRKPERTLRLVEAPAVKEQHPIHKWRRHPQLRSYNAPLSQDVREGRAAAVRGLAAARAGALEVARQHFTRAAQCEDVDITAVPDFWKLTRGQMQTAVDAYEAAGRYRDAAALDAHISTIFRPSLVGVRQQPIIPTRQQQKAVST